jgi:hypothetical protein
MLAVAVASTVMAYQSSRAAAADQNAYMQENAEAAVENARRNYADIQARQVKEQSAASHELACRSG